MHWKGESKFKILQIEHLSEQIQQTFNDNNKEFSWYSYQNKWPVSVMRYQREMKENSVGYGITEYEIIQNWMGFGRSD